MPWSAAYYPPAMDHLLPPARSKAIEIAHAMLARGHDEGTAIRIAIATAKDAKEKQQLVRQVRITLRDSETHFPGT